MVEIIYTVGVDFISFGDIKIYKNVPIKVKKEIAESLIKKSFGLKYVVGKKEDKVFKEE